MKGYKALKNSSLLRLFVALIAITRRQTMKKSTLTESIVAGTAMADHEFPKTIEVIS